MRPHVCVQRTQVCELLPFVARHLVQQSTFHMYDFVVREGKDEVFAPGVEEPKCERVVIAAAEEGIGLKIFERVVHPPHVPLEIETEPARVYGTADGGPRR